MCGGILRVNGPVSFGVRHIAPLMADFHRAHPAVTVELGLNDRLVDLVEEGWDMAIRIGRLASSALIARKLAPITLMLCASPGYLRAHGTPQRAQDLPGPCLPRLHASRAVGVDSWAFGTDGDVVVPVQGPLRSSNGDVLLAAAISGLGLTYQPSFLLAEAVQSGLLTPIELDHPPVDIGGIHAIYPPGGRLPAKARVFIDYLATCFGGPARWDRHSA